jgi:hypothetical protein
MNTQELITLRNSITPDNYWLASPRVVDLQDHFNFLNGQSLIDALEMSVIPSENFGQLSYEQTCHYLDWLIARSQSTKMETVFVDNKPVQVAAVPSSDEPIPADHHYIDCQIFARNPAMRKCTCKPAANLADSSNPADVPIYACHTLALYKQKFPTETRALMLVGTGPFADDVKISYWQGNSDSALLGSEITTLVYVNDWTATVKEVSI